MCPYQPLCALPHSSSDTHFTCLTFTVYDLALPPSLTSFSPDKITGPETIGDRRGTSLGGLKLGGAGGMNLGEVARTPWVTRLVRVTDEADRWFVSEVVRATRAFDSLRYPL